MKIRAAHSVLLLAAVSLLLPGSAALAGKGTSQADTPKRYIYSRSARETSSDVLGLSGVPAYVNFPDGSQKRGVYVTRQRSGGLCRRMGLAPGCVLTTVNNQTAESPSTVDNLLKGQSNISFSYVKLVDGRPRVFSSSVTSDGAAGGAPPWPPTGSSISMSGFNKPSKDTTPTSALESHGVQIVNQDRRANGSLPALAANSRLTELARKYAEYLLKTNTFSHFDLAGHSPLDRARQSGIVCSLRENIALQPRTTGKGDLELVADAERQMMNEPPNQENHRGNILCTNGVSIGVGIARNAKTLMLVHEIADINP
jgi:uncharacterized protein YkwD